MDKLSQFVDMISTFVVENIWEPIKAMTVVDYADVLLLTIIFFMVIRFISNRRAGKLITGCLLIVFVFLIAEALDMHAMKFILSNFYQVGLIAIIIIFQDELRSALEKVGGISSKIVSGITDSADKELNEEVTQELKNNIDQICEAVFAMSEASTGALIVIEKDTKVGDCIESGIKIDAQISSQLLQNIFVNKSPLHDGAVIIREMRIAAAGCYLPATSRKISDSLGTRHKAAVGLSEIASDAVVIVVSEETGTVSLCYNGEIRRGYDMERLSRELKRRFGRGKKKRNKTRGVKKDAGEGDVQSVEIIDDSDPR